MGKFGSHFGSKMECGVLLTTKWSAEKVDNFSPTNRGESLAGEIGITHLEWFMEQ